MILIAAAPVIYYSYESYSTKVWIKKDREQAAIHQLEQAAQIELAKSADISITASAGKAERIATNDEYDNHLVRIPLTVENLPEGLKRYNIRCDGVEVTEGVFVDSSKFHTECNIVQARKNGEGWKYSLYSGWDGIVLNQPEIVIRFTTGSGQSLPNFKFIKAQFYIPSEEGELYPGSLSKEQQIVFVERIPVKLK